MIKFLIVLYNKRLCECETCSSIMSWRQDLRSQLDVIYIWNNSPIFITREEKEQFMSYFPEADVVFYEDGYNHPLSEVYNSIIGETDSLGILTLWDHDSKVPEGFIPALKEAELNHNVNLYLPQILFHGALVSPGQMFYFWGRTLKSIKTGLHKTDNLTCINSGMSIRCSYLKGPYPGYDEKIKFYGTDNDFMFKYRNQNDYLYVLPIQIRHELNSFSKTDVEDSINRYRDIKNGIYQLSKHFPLFIRILSRIYIWGVSTKLNLQNKTTRFW